MTCIKRRNLPRYDEWPYWNCSWYVSNCVLIDVLNGSYISLNYLYMSCHNKKFPVLSIQLLFYMEACESGSMFEYLLAKNRNSKQFEPTHRYNNYNSFSLWLNAFTFKLSVHVFTCTLSLPLSLSLSLTSTCIYIFIVIYNMNMYSHWMLTPPSYFHISHTLSLIVHDLLTVLAVTASNATTSSYACYFDKKRKTYLGDVFSVKWMEDSDKVDQLFWK